MYHELKTNANELVNKVNYTFNGWGHLFSSGGQWMTQVVALVANKDIPLVSKKDFQRWGWTKYISCLLSAFTVLFILWNIHPGIAILGAISAFYLIEIHFLFIFPLLIHGAPSPFKQNLKYVYQYGLGKSFLLTIKIACFMLLGLFQFKDPLNNWKIGCVMVLLWFQQLHASN